MSIFWCFNIWEYIYIVTCLDLGYTVKYSLSPRDFPRAQPIFYRISLLSSKHRCSRGVLLRSVPRAIRGRNLLKFTFGANFFYFTKSLYLIWWRRAVWPKLLGEYMRKKSMFNFFWHTLTFQLFLVFSTTCGRQLFERALISVLWQPNAKICLIF